MDKLKDKKKKKKGKKGKKKDKVEDRDLITLLKLKFKGLFIFSKSSLMSWV